MPLARSTPDRTHARHTRSERTIRVNVLVDEPARAFEALDKICGGDDESRTPDLRSDKLRINVVSETHILAEAANALKGILGPDSCG